MNVQRLGFLLPIAALAAVVALADGAFAQERGRGRGGRGDQSSPPPASTGRAAPRREAPAVQQAPRSIQRAPRVTPQREPFNRDVRTGRGQSPPGPSISRPAPLSRAVPRTAPRYEAPRYDSAPRYYVTPRYNAPRYAPPRYYNAPRYNGPRYVTPYGIPRPQYPRYYSFRPRLHVGFGLFIGYPVSFPSWYDPYRPGRYSGYRQGYSYGGLSFDIQPYDADLYIDGEYVGTADDFSPYRRPLTLTAGRHHIELHAPGFAPMSFDITVVPGQVIPYQGTLSR